jgi:hypothetical protein
MSADFVDLFSERSGQYAAQPTRIELPWTLAEFTAYVSTGSAVKRLEQERGAEALEDAWTALAACWGTADRRRVVTMPIRLQVRRKPA